MSKKALISRRNVVKGAAASMVAAACSGVTPAFAEDVQTLTSTDAVGFLYIDGITLEPGIEQNIAVSFKDLSGVENAALVLSAACTDEPIEVASSSVSESSVLFTLTPEFETTYTVESLSVTAASSSYIVDFGDCAADERSFSVGAELALMAADDDSALANGDIVTSYIAVSDDDLTAYDSLDGALDALQIGADAASLELYSKDGGITSKSQKFTIGLDPGHCDGKDSGAKAYDGKSATEAQKNWPIMWYCMEELETYDNVACAISRDYNKNPTIEQRVKNCYNLGAEVVVSFHCNSANVASANGCEVLVPGKQSYNRYTYTIGKELGNNILAELEKLGLHNRGLLFKRGATGTSDTNGEVHYYPTGEDGDYYGIVRHARKLGMVGIIIEHCFVSNKSDYQNHLSTVDQLKALAKADATGIAKTYNLVKTSAAKKDTTPKKMYRLYNPNSGEHFYTADTTEHDSLVKEGWRDEGIGWTAPGYSNTPVYRMYNSYAGDHHYTTDGAERRTLAYAGWTYEGIGWYSDDNKAVPLYRQYNPNASAGAHNYTTSKEENDHLVSVGWRAEGIGWYGVK